MEENNRHMCATVALLLGVTPQTVDEMPVRDVYDVFYAHNAKVAAQNFKSKYGGK